MGEPVTPRKGPMAAPSQAAAPDLKSVSTGPKSAPTEAPSVASTKTPRTGGDFQTPQSVKSNKVEMVAPRRTGRDGAIERTN
jgi:hypothetical protein